MEYECVSSVFRLDARFVKDMSQWVGSTEEHANSVSIKEISRHFMTNHHIVLSMHKTNCC